MVLETPPPPSVTLSHTNVVSPSPGDNQCPPQTLNKCAPPEVPTGTLTGLLWHPPAPFAAPPRFYMYGGVRGGWAEKQHINIQRTVCG